MKVEVKFQLNYAEGCWFIIRMYVHTTVEPLSVSIYGILFVAQAVNTLLCKHSNTNLYVILPV